MSTSLPLSNIINVAVSIAPAPAPGPSFNQALIIGPSTHIPSQGANSRLRLYQSLTAMTQDGFLTTDPEYLAAEVYFGQTPKPTFLKIGRQNLTAIATETISTAGTGYAVGDIITVVQSGASGGTLRVTTVGTGGAVTGLQKIQGAQGSGYSVASALHTTGGSGTGLEVNITAIGETAVEAVTACRVADPAWYACMFVGTAVDADHLAIAAYIEAAEPASVYFLTSGSVAVLNVTAGNLFAALQAAEYRRTFAMYATTQSGTFPHNAYASAAPMGYAMGANNGTSGSYFDIMFKGLAGVAAEPLTQSQVNAICGTVDRSSPGLNGNVMLDYQNGSYTWLQPAIMASGVFFDEVLNLDMLASDMQQSGVALLTSVPALPITDAGVIQMKTALAGACDRAKERGFIAPSGVWQGVDVGSGSAAVKSGQALPNGYYLYAPPVSTLSRQSRAARVMPPITVLVIEAQSGHSLSVTLSVQR